MRVSVLAVLVIRSYIRDGIDNNLALVPSLGLSLGPYPMSDRKCRLRLRQAVLGIISLR